MALTGLFIRAWFKVPQFNKDDGVTKGGKYYVHRDGKYTEHTKMVKPWHAEVYYE